MFSEKNTSLASIDVVIVAVLEGGGGGEREMGRRQAAIVRIAPKKCVCPSLRARVFFVCLCLSRARGGIISVAVCLFSRFSLSSLVTGGRAPPFLFARLCFYTARTRQKKVCPFAQQKNEHIPLDGWTSPLPSPTNFSRKILEQITRSKN